MEDAEPGVVDVAVDVVGEERWRQREAATSERRSRPRPAAGRAGRDQQDAELGEEPDPDQGVGRRRREAQLLAAGVSLAAAPAAVGVAAGAGGGGWYRGLGRFLADPRGVGVRVVAAGRFASRPFGFAFRAADPDPVRDPLRGAGALKLP